MRNLNFYGLIRSGNHAIIFWMLHNLGEIREIKDVKKLFYKESYRKFWYTGYNYYFNNVTRSQVINFPREYNLLIKSYEDIIPDSTSENSFIILRDILNGIASRHKAYGLGLAPNNKYLTDIDVIIDMWKKHFEIILKKQNGIIYNKWVIDKKYRDEVSIKLNIPNKIDDISFVPYIGYGSSFILFNKEPDNYSYLTRYMQHKLPDEIIHKLVEDDELVNIHKEFFGLDFKEIYNKERIEYV